MAETQPATRHAIEVALKRKQRSREIIIANYEHDLTAINGEINELLESKKVLLQEELRIVDLLKGEA